jgi:hypothetical protein
MKKLAFPLACALLMFATVTAQAAIISVDTVPGGPVDAMATVDQGDSFDLDIVIEDVMDLAGFQFDLGFDGAVLTATAITSGGVFDPFTFNVAETIGANSISFAEISLLGGVDFVGPTVLATISFDAVAAGTSALVFSNVLLSDSGAGSITPVTENDGEIAVTGAAPLPGTLLLMVTGLGMMGRRRFFRPSVPRVAVR